MCFRFCVGDRFYLCDNRILCEYDYEERMVFASMNSGNNNGSVQNLKQNRQVNHIPHVSDILHVLCFYVLK